MSDTPAGTRYQPEIDGLRAVAVTSTVFFHADVPGFAGGFAGVDVFFVISGFLITRLLLSELAHKGGIDLVAFFARRIRRLLPSLITVVVTVLVIGSFILSPAGERQGLSLSAVATAAFLANLYFWRTQAHYFAGPAEWLPLLNMWTLSVEEQFYLVWPLLLLLAGAAARATRLSARNVIGAMLALIFVVSICLFLWGAAAKPTGAFYLTPTRVWELALGAGLALAGGRIGRFAALASGAVLFGSVAIVSAVVLPPRSLDYSLTVLLAAFGAAAVIGGTSMAPTSSVARLLAMGAVVMIGRLSYSWYLWHWPLLALVRLYDFGRASLVRDMLAVGVALVLSVVTYRLIENPIRKRRVWPFSGDRQTLATGALLSVATVLLALALHFDASKALGRDPWLENVHGAKASKVRAPAGCHLFGSAELAPAQACLVGAADVPPRILLWGDSHAEHLVEMMNADGRERGYATLVRTASSCPPALLVGRSRPLWGSCDAFNEAVARELPALKQSGVAGIVLGSRGYGWPGEAVQAELAAWKEGLRTLLSAARNARVRVLLIAPVPSFRHPVPECLARLEPAQCGISRAELDRTRGPLVAALREIVASFDDVRLWDPIELFCDSAMCVPARDGVVLFSDESHLTVRGSRGLLPGASEYIGWLLSPSGTGR